MTNLEEAEAWRDVMLAYDLLCVCSPRSSNVLLLRLDVANAIKHLKQVVEANDPTTKNKFKKVKNNT